MHGRLVRCPEIIGARFRSSAAWCNPRTDSIFAPKRTECRCVSPCPAYYYTTLPLTTGAVMARPSPWCAKVAMAGQPAEAKSPPRRCEREGCLGWSTRGGCVGDWASLPNPWRAKVAMAAQPAVGSLRPRAPALGVLRLPWLVNLLWARSGFMCQPWAC